MQGGGVWAYLRAASGRDHIVLVLERVGRADGMEGRGAHRLEGSRFGTWNGNLATFFTARLPLKHVLNRRLPGITQRIVFVQRLRP
jgi:hypothetical protein